MSSALPPAGWQAIVGGMAQIFPVNRSVRCAESGIWECKGQIACRRKQREGRKKFFNCVQCSLYFPAFFILIEDAVFVIAMHWTHFFSLCIFIRCLLYFYEVLLFSINNFYFFTAVFLWVWMLTKDYMDFYLLILLWLHFLYIYM